MPSNSVSELCHIPPETLGQHCHLREHSEAHCCCGKSLIGSALVCFGMRQHARAEPISKRAPSATRTSTPNYHAVGRVAVRQPPECDAMLQPRQPTAIVRVECCTTTRARPGFESRPGQRCLQTICCERFREWDLRGLATTPQTGGAGLRHGDPVRDGPGQRPRSALIRARARAPAGAARRAG